MTVLGTPRSVGLMPRVINILTRPRAEWEQIAMEPASTPGLFLGYAVILAAIQPIAMVIHGLMPACFFGVVCTTPNPVFVVIIAVVQFVLSLASAFFVGLIINALAPSFGGEKNAVQAMKVAVYSWTAFWLAGVFAIVPWVGGMLTIIFGLYSFVLLYFGLPMLMKSPPAQALGYTAVVVILGIVVSFVISLVLVPITAMGALSSVAANNAITVHTSDGASVNLGQLQQGLQQMAQQAQAASGQGGQAGQPGQSGAPGQAPANFVAVPADKLKAVLPDNIGGAPRTELTSTSTGVGALTNAEATYSNADIHVTLTITDLGAASPLLTLAGAVGVQHDEQTATGYERTSTVNGQLTTDKYDTSSKSGEYSIVVGNRFNIDASGSGVSIDVLKAAVNAAQPQVASLAHG
jgi:hypothetical protein